MTRARAPLGTRRAGPAVIVTLTLNPAIDQAISRTGR